jgi:hypothetical protein
MISHQSTGLTYASTPDQVYSVTGTREVTQINVQNGNSLKITFTATNFMNPGEFFLIRVPLDQMQVDSSNFACKTAQRTDAPATVPCTIDESTSTTYFIVTLQAPCPQSCADENDYTVIFSSGVINPPWINPGITSTI